MHEISRGKMEKYNMLFGVVLFSRHSCTTELILKPNLVKWVHWIKLQKQTIQWISEK